jgi:hypothetical protein
MLSFILIYVSLHLDLSCADFLFVFFLPLLFYFHEFSLVPKFLNLVKPFLVILPDVTRPVKYVPTKEKVYWSVCSLLTFLVCCQIPLYGVSKNATSTDPLSWVRAILASNRGTLMELGVSPIITGTYIQASSSDFV